MRFPSCALAATLLLVSSATLAQTSSALRWSDGAPNAISEVKDNNKIEGLKTDDVHIYVSMAEIKETEYNRVWVQVANHSKTPITLDPQSAVLLNGTKTEKPDVPDKAANNIQKVGEAKSQELSSAHCAEMLSGGHSGGMGPCQPTDTQVQMGKQIASLSAKQAQWVRDNGLQQKPVDPGTETRGAIVFRKDKKAADYIFRIAVGSTIFEFPLSAQNKAPSYN
jgi:hypothetical protein